MASNVLRAGEQVHIYVESSYMNSQELKRWLAKQGCTFSTYPGGSGHMYVHLGNRRTTIPMHGSRKELGPGIVNKIKKDLGLK